VIILLPKLSLDAKLFGRYRTGGSSSVNSLSLVLVTTLTDHSEEWVQKKSFWYVWKQHSQMSNVRCVDDAEGFQRAAVPFRIRSPPVQRLVDDWLPRAGRARCRVSVETTNNCATIYWIRQSAVDATDIAVHWFSYSPDRVEPSVRRHSIFTRFRS